jgi:hypothetical protein
MRFPQKLNIWQSDRVLLKDKSCPKDMEEILINKGRHGTDM